MQTSSALPRSLASPSWALLATEPLRALFDFAASGLAPGPQPLGDNHPVIVYPGLGGGALSTLHLRKYLKRSGFAVSDWGGGINTGPHGDLDHWLDTLASKLHTVQAAHGGQKVSLVGWSLGGVYARELAKRAPDSVRQVITLGTPFASLESSNHASGIFKLLNRDKAQMTPALAARLRQCPPVPTTSVYSKKDGIVSWRACIEQSTLQTENIEVKASHLGMGTHPQVLRVIANRLAQPAGHWRAMARPDQGAQVTRPLQAVASTTTPKAMRYQANGTKLWVEM